MEFSKILPLLDVEEIIKQAIRYRWIKNTVDISWDLLPDSYFMLIVQGHEPIIDVSMDACIDRAIENNIGNGCL